jgi:hypothetical protein
VVLKELHPTEIREIIIGGNSIAVEESYISMVREIEKDNVKKYLSKSQVPLKDFRKFFNGFAGQFVGTLSTIKGKKLKKLILPIVIPVGIGLSELPDENSSAMIILSNGQWHGVLFCRQVKDETKYMTKFKTARNGDITGVGYFEDGGNVSLLNIANLLKREGFLAIV